MTSELIKLQKRNKKYQSGVITPALSGSNVHSFMQIDMNNALVNNKEIKLMGRLSADAPWFLLNDYTESGLYELTLNCDMMIVTKYKARIWMTNVHVFDEPEALEV